MWHCCWGCNPWPLQECNTFIFKGQAVQEESVPFLTRPLVMKITHSFKMLEISNPATQCHIPDDRNPQLHLPENRKMHQSHSSLARTEAYNIHHIFVSVSDLLLCGSCGWLHFVFNCCRMCFQGCDAMCHGKTLLTQWRTRFLLSWGYFLLRWRKSVLLKCR
jgi:hypothetical protein